MIYCDYCGKSIFGYENIPKKVQSSPRYHEGCKAKAQYERAKQRNLLKKQQTQPKQVVKREPQGRVAPILAKFMTDEEYWQSDTYKEIVERNRKYNTKVKNV